MSLASAAEKLEVTDSLAALRRSAAQWLLRERGRTRLATGIPDLDAVLAGGWPQGRLSEIIGAVSSGTGGIAAATVAAAAGRGEVAAWIDAADALDPPAMHEAGVDLGRVLWVRPRGLLEAVRAVELVLETGGFSLVVLDLFGDGAVSAGRRWTSPLRVQDGGGRMVTLPGGGRRRGKGAFPLRLARAVERAAAVVLVLVDRSWAGTLAGVTVALERGGPLWGGAGRGEPRWLVGFSSVARLERGGANDRQRRTTLRFVTGAGYRAPDPENEPWGEGREEHEAAYPEQRQSSRAGNGRSRVVPESGARRSEPWAVGGGQEGWAV